MSKNKLKNISKFLSLILRHKPETINLELDKNGWADIDELIEKKYFTTKLTLFFSDITIQYSLTIKKGFL